MSTSSVIRRRLIQLGECPPGLRSPFSGPAENSCSSGRAKDFTEALLKVVSHSQVLRFNVQVGAPRAPSSSAGSG